jgi:hypothetical protein
MSNVNDYNKIQGHPKGGFADRLTIRIEANGYINTTGFDLYVLHGIVLAVSWGLLSLL